MGTHNNLYPFEYRIIRKKRKTITIKVTNEAEVIITSPFGISEETIQNIVKKKQNWILSKVAMIQSKNTCKKTILQSGYKVLYLGKEFELDLNYEDQNNHQFNIKDGKLKVFFNSSVDLTEDVVKNHIIKMYKKEAEKILIERTKIYSEIIHQYPVKITIKSQNTIWGSCSSKRNINYNYKIIRAPIEVVDYIVVHELCHLIHMNHSKNYWNTVGSILPDYKVRRQWLKNNQFIGG